MTRLATNSPVPRDAQCCFEVLRFDGAIKLRTVSENQPRRHDATGHYSRGPDVHYLGCEEGPGDGAKNRDVARNNISAHRGRGSDGDSVAIAPHGAALHRTFKKEILAGADFAIHEDLFA
jgi:hypothetical protein